MKGRKPKPTKQQIAEGDPRKRGVNKLDAKLAAEPKAPRGLPQCPKHLEMLHLRGLSANGLVGMSTVSVMAESIGAGLAAQECAARFFENDQTPSGVLIHPTNLSEAAYARMKASWREQQSGANQHSLKIVEEGMTYQNIGVTNKDSQLLEARQFS